MSGQLVYGCMGLGGGWSAEPLTTVDIDVAERAVFAALDAGITWFDQADIYRHGKSEAALGAVLARHSGLRERIRIQTKCGIRLGENGLRSYYDLSRASILERVRGSLGRLGTDFVDILLMHRPDPLAEPEEIAAAFGELREEGRVGALGVSNMSAAQMAHLQRSLDEPLVVNQLEMSLRKRDWVDAGVQVNHSGYGRFPEGTLEYCSANAVRVQAWGALAQGVYTGAGSEAEAGTTELVAKMASEKDTTPEAIVLGWLMRHPAGIEPVVGTTSPDRVLACADAPAQAAAMTRVEWYSLYLSARGEPLP
ncbi:aldo/keto reductase [Amycolatopsis sp. CA-230715]|uniref:aldo/keto reductase n=1 Tax=Amycolatopsis sp. CA-230715 TaxID=2745196 RepID=UPI001C01DD5C|nr:aldo/keto reductase [Amycolatopsis sp. CA-230715]QWF84733.1 Oxidoreductase YdhF [Amycolatopsis sp. CA-230715]